MRIDENFMNEVGLEDMPSDQKQAFMAHAEEELEIRVGQGIGVGLTDEQMDEFERIDDLAVAADWLEKNVPDYRSVIERIYENFKQELIAERQNILA